MHESSRTPISPKRKASFPIHVLRGKDSFDRPCYWFVMCPHERIRRMLKIQETCPRDISQIGMIVASGLGETLSDHVRGKLKQHYDCDADALFNAAQPV